MADIKGFRRKYDSLLAWMARNLVYDFLDGAAAGGILSECLLDRPDFYGWDQRFVHVRTDPLLYDTKAGIAGGRMDCNQRSSSVSFPAVYPQHEIRDFLVEWNSALYHSILSGDVICVVFFPIYRYISDSVWNWCIAVYDRIGWFQLSGSAVRAYRSGGSIARLWKEPEKIALAVGMFWSGNGGTYGQCIVSGKCDPGRGVLRIFCIQSYRNHIAIFSARHADDPAICGRKAIRFRDPDFDGCLFMESLLQNGNDAVFLPLALSVRSFSILSVVCDVRTGDLCRGGGIRRRSQHDFSSFRTDGHGGNRVYVGMGSGKTWNRESAEGMENLEKLDFCEHGVSVPADSRAPKGNAEGNHVF